MWYGSLFSELGALRNYEKAIPMAAYMRNQFSFLDVSAGPRKMISKSYLKEALQNHIIDFDFVDLCFKREEREYHLLAVDYLLYIQNLLTPEHLPLIKKYILTKSWWDTVDGLDGVVGKMSLRYPEVKETMIEWSQTDSVWLRRVAIDHQLLFKDQTDTALLETIIVNNLGQKEFFINKAIGWALRDFSKTDPEWVWKFIQKYREALSPLSIRERSKYLTRK